MEFGSGRKWYEYDFLSIKQEGKTKIIHYGNKPGPWGFDVKRIITVEEDDEVFTRGMNQCFFGEISYDFEIAKESISFIYCKK